ncbi:MAG: hypothetical protein HY506_00965 [Candidatus Yanofskybacteria bacterium]|nr:hypothetical protein [Candidatus Yanofskybacteria bacterium]
MKEAKAMNKPNTLIGITKEELLGLRPEDVTWLLTVEEVVHMAEVLSAFWSYNYHAAVRGRVGLHALLKSELHSNGFFTSKILLEPENIRQIMARQIVMRLEEKNISKPDYVAGVPDGATELGKSVAEILGVSVAEMKKVDGRIVLATEIPVGSTLLLAEDFCTRGTGFTEAVLEIDKKNPGLNFVSYNPVIINRGGVRRIYVAGVGEFKVLPVVERKIDDWDPSVCPLCRMGSKPIKPKASDENWRLITTSQLPKTALD